MALAKMGAQVHIACRSRERGEAALTKIAEVSKETPKLHLLDLSKSDDVHRFAKKFKQEVKELYCLVNNAGCMVNEEWVLSYKL